VCSLCPTIEAERDITITFCLPKSNQAALELKNDSLTRSRVVQMINNSEARPLQNVY